MMKKAIIISLLVASVNALGGSSPFKYEKVLVIGASSGMGKASVLEMSKRFGSDVVFGIAARRAEKLQEVADSIPQTCHIQSLDASQPEHATQKMKELINQMGGVDLCLMTISSCYDNSAEMNLDIEKNYIEIDVLGVTTLIHHVFSLFEEQGYGHMATITSLDRERGNAGGGIYCACKAYQSKYLEGRRNGYIQNNIPIYVTELIPGWVDNEKVLFSKKDHTYWVIDSPQAAVHIVDAIEQRKKEAFIAPRQWIISLLLKIVPDSIYNALGGF